MTIEEITRLTEEARNAAANIDKEIKEACARENRIDTSWDGYPDYVLTVEENHRRLDAWAKFAELDDQREETLRQM